ncbi:MAG: hypothetical protein ACK5RE_15090 [Pseudanabaena sp.]
MKEPNKFSRRENLFAILIMKPSLVFPEPQALETPKSVFESPPMSGFQKPTFIKRIIDKLTLRVTYQ